MLPRPAFCGGCTCLHVMMLWDAVWPRFLPLVLFLMAPLRAKGKRILGWRELGSVKGLFFYEFKFTYSSYWTFPQDPESQMGCPCGAGPWYWQGIRASLGPAT